jgi:hypothetical protein
METRTADLPTVAPPATPEQGGVPPLRRGERWLLRAVAVLAAGVGGLGLASSFEALKKAADRWGFAHSWMLPVGIDAAIPAFTLANLLLIRMDMRLAWVRFVPWALTAVTCWLNVAAGHSASAKLAHGTMPLLWVVLSEIAAHVYAVRIGAATGRRMDRIRRSRWLLAPFSTFALWRRMVLWEITSYPDALAREHERQLARAQLRETHGRAWRRKAPRRERTLLKLGELTPAGSLPSAAPDAQRPLVIRDGSGLGIPAVPTKRKRAVPPPPPKQRRKPTATGKGRGKASASGRGKTDDEVLEEARTVTADWPVDDLTAERLMTALHVGPKRARMVRDTLKSERADRAAPGADAPAVPEPAGVAA